MNYNKFKLNIDTKKREQLLLITRKIEKIITNSKIKEGLCKIYIPHTTAGITINENADPHVEKDMTKFLNELIPQSNQFLHNEGNSDSHIKSSLIGFSIDIPILQGKLDLGIWQGIFFCEFDGPRKRTVKILIYN